MRQNKYQDKTTFVVWVVKISSKSSLQCSFESGVFYKSAYVLTFVAIYFLQVLSECFVSGFDCLLNAWCFLKDRLTVIQVFNDWLEALK